MTDEHTSYKLACEYAHLIRLGLCESAGIKNSFLERSDSKKWVEFCDDLWICFGMIGGDHMVNIHYLS